MDESTLPDDGALSVEPILPAYQQVADGIRGAILDGRIAPGERLPVEMDLTQLFGVSRSTVREALRTLSSLNLVTTSRGVTGGTYVSHPNPDAVSQYLEVCIGLMSDANVVSVAELIETRKVLEVHASRLSAQQQNLELISQLRACLEGSKAEIERPDFEGNRLFHILILESAGNRIVNLLTQPVFSVMRTRFARREASPEFWTNVNNDHLDIAAAIEAGDSDKAARLMTEHLERLGAVYASIDRSTRSST